MTIHNGPINGIKSRIRPRIVSGIGSWYELEVTNQAQAQARDGLAYDNLFRFQDTTDATAVDDIGSSDLDVNTSTVAGIPMPYCSRLARKFTHNTGESIRATSGGELDPGTESMYIGIKGYWGQAPGGGDSRDIFAKGGGAPRYHLSMRTSDSAMRGQVHDGGGGVGLLTVHVDGDHTNRHDLIQFYIDRGSDTFQVRTGLGSASADITGAASFGSAGAFKLGAALSLCVEMWVYELVFLFGSAADNLDLADIRAKSWRGP